MNKRSEGEQLKTWPQSSMTNSIGRHRGSMKIAGRFVDATDQPLSDYRVVAYHGDVNLKKEKSLGTTRMGKDGTYSFSPSASLNIRIDATIPDAVLGISEYKRLSDQISPLLQGANLSELQPAQIAYLGRVLIQSSSGRNSSRGIVGTRLATQCVDRRIPRSNGPDPIREGGG